MTAQAKPARDWRALDAAHRRRGELITVFFSPDGEAFAPAPPSGKHVLLVDSTGLKVFGEG
jgi:hypothetical protein